MEKLLKNERPEELLAKIEGTKEADWARRKTMFRAIVEELDLRLWEYKNFLKRLPKNKKRTALAAVN